MVTVGGAERRPGRRLSNGGCWEALYGGFWRAEEEEEEGFLRCRRDMSEKSMCRGREVAPGKGGKLMLLKGFLDGFFQGVYK